MAVELEMPELAESVIEGEIVKWLVKEGEHVKQDQPLVEVMTDKVTVEIPSPYEGVLLKQVAPEGAVVPIGKPIAIFGKEGETIADVHEHAQAPRKPGGDHAAAAAVARNSAHRVRRPARSAQTATPTRPGNGQPRRTASRKPKPRSSVLSADRSLRRPCADSPASWVSILRTSVAPAKAAASDARTSSGSQILDRRRRAAARRRTAAAKNPNAFRCAAATRHRRSHGAQQAHRGAHAACRRGRSHGSGRHARTRQSESQRPRASSSPICRSSSRR